MIHSHPQLHGAVGIGILFVGNLVTLACLPPTVFADGGKKKGAPRPAAVSATDNAEHARHDKTPSGKSTPTAKVAIPGKFWIGVVCQPVDDRLLEIHLGIASGLVVTDVIPDSPAAKAGLKKDDILLKAGDATLTDLSALVTVIKKAGGQEIPLQLVRQGTRATIRVTPVPRPAQYSIPNADEMAKEWKMLQDALRRHGAISETDDNDPIKHDLSSLMLIMPGFLLPDDAKKLPKDIEITITKKGPEKAKITVKRKDQQWTVAPDSLDTLPDDIRPYVEQMLGRGTQMHIRVDGNGLDWMKKTFPKGLLGPQILNESLRIAPNRPYKLRRVPPKLKRELSGQIEEQLQQARRALETAKPPISTEALEKIENEVRALRQKLEEMLRKATDDQRDTE